jgi:tetratricopeptide (TPR) repeat protein
MGAMLAYTNGQLRLAAGDDPVPVIELGLAWYPGNRALLFLKARALVKGERFDEALAILAALTREDAATFCDPALSYDRRIFGSFAHDLTGVALLRMGRRAEAAAAFLRAAAAEPDNPAFRIKAMALRPNPVTPAG